MSISFVTGIENIQKAQKPIGVAWRLACEYMGVDPKINKIIEILGDHENLFVNRNRYHNHYHLAEVIWASAWLAANEFTKEEMNEHAIVLLMAATFHDAEHPGRGNKEDFEIEKKSSYFFQQWWKNNSLFVENIIKIKASEMEQVITEMILFTDFTAGHKKVNYDYKNHKEYEFFGLKSVKLKKILNEADILMSVLPQYGFHKTELLLKEADRQIDDKTKWVLLLEFLENTGLKTYESNGSKALKLPEMILEFIGLLKIELKNPLINSEDIQKRLYEKFGK